MLVELDNTKEYMAKNKRTQSERFWFEPISSGYSDCWGTDSFIIDIQSSYGKCSRQLLNNLSVTSYKFAPQSKLFSQS